MNYESSKLHAPSWVKIISLLLLVAAFLLSGWVVVNYIDTGRHDWVLVAISLAQIAITGIVFLMVYFFSERDYSVQSLRKMSEKFIAVEVKGSLERIELQFDANRNPIVEVSEGWCGILGKNIKIHLDDYVAYLWIGINVNKIWCIYSFQDFQDGTDKSGEKLREKLRTSIEGSEQTGYNVNITYVEPDEECGNGAYSLWATVTDKEHPYMLSSAHRRLFYANDIAMMTHSILNTAYRENINPCEHHRPKPL